MRLHSIDPRTVRDITPTVLDERKRPRVLPASFYKGTTAEERAVCGVRNALYGLPTLELVDWLRKTINGRSAIEIGAGHGVLADTLGIPATDNRMQEDPSVQAHYRLLRQPVITYGDNVEQLDAVEAVHRHRPDVVIASWVTHRFDPNREDAEGNMFGIVEEDVIAGCRTYIFIGNTLVHQNKSIWALPHSRFTPDWLFSRAVNGSPDFIAVWGDFVPEA